MSQLNYSPHPRLAAIIKELKQLAGVEYALVALTTTPLTEETSPDTYVDHVIPPFDGKFYSVWASADLKAHIVPAIEEHLAPALIEHKQAQELPRFALDATDTEALVAYLSACLYLLQQETCKNIARTWIKHIEPKKQSKYPYKRGALTAPPWWPKHAVQHKEPDHLQKDERIGLLVHLLLYSDFSLETLNEASNENKEVVPSHKRVFVEQAFHIAEIYRLMHRTNHPVDAPLDVGPFRQYYAINVYALTYGQNRYERKDDVRTGGRTYRGFGLPVSRDPMKSESPMMSGACSPMLGMQHRPVEPPTHPKPALGWFKPMYNQEPYHGGKYRAPSSYYPPSYHPYNGYYPQPLSESHQMRSPPSSASSGNVSMESTEEMYMAQKRPMVEELPRPITRSISR